MSELSLQTRQYLDAEKLALGAFAPLTGFMNEAEFHHVVEHLRLPNGDVRRVPIEIPE